MFKNEVLALKEDKDRLVELINEVYNILDKYEYSSDYSIHSVTSMSRAKTAVSEAKQWISYLEIK